MADATVASVCVLGGSYGLPIHISVLPSLRLLFLACGRGASKHFALHPPVAFFSPKDEVIMTLLLLMINNYTVITTALCDADHLEV